MANGSNGPGEARTELIARRSTRRSGGGAAVHRGHRGHRVRAAGAQRDAQLQRRARDALEANDSYGRWRPWPVIGAAAVVGVVLGLLVSRR